MARGMVAGPAGPIRFATAASRPRWLTVLWPHLSCRKHSRLLAPAFVALLLACHVTLALDQRDVSARRPLHPPVAVGSSLLDTYAVAVRVASQAPLAPRQSRDCPVRAAVTPLLAALVALLGAGARMNGPGLQPLLGHGLASRPVPVSIFGATRRRALLQIYRN